MGNGEPETVNEDVSNGQLSCNKDTSVEAHRKYSAHESTTCVPNGVEREPHLNACSPETMRSRQKGISSVVKENCDHPNHPIWSKIV